MPVRKAEELHDFVRSILMAAGASDENASRVADSLVSAHLSGVDTHGVFHVPMYVSHIKQSFILPRALPSIVKQTAASALVSGNWTFGHVATKYALDLAVKKAREGGMASVGVVRTHHNGRLGEYMEMAANAGVVAMMFGGGQGRENPVSVPHGGRRSLFSTNPMAMGFPLADGTNFVLDFATTATSGSKVMLARDRGEKVPLGCVVDADGNPTTDPGAFFNKGGLVPFGGHKGYALLVAVELLGRVFTGADARGEAAHGGPYMRYQGITIVCLARDLFADAAVVDENARDLARRVRETPAAAGFSEVLVPGDPEARTRKLRARDGIDIPETVWASLNQAATSLGLAARS